MKHDIVSNEDGYLSAKAGDRVVVLSEVNGYALCRKDRIVRFRHNQVTTRMAIFQSIC